MKRGHLSRKDYFLMLASVFIFMASVAVFILCFSIDQRNGSNRTVIAIVASAGASIPIWICVAVAIFVPMFSQKSSQRVNYPRIEHLRIAGKYAPTSAAKIGVSPLHLL
jgi:NADH:ubiquinone oxidoreductase subunit K